MLSFILFLNLQIEGIRGLAPKEIDNMLKTTYTFITRKLLFNLAVAMP